MTEKRVKELISEASCRDINPESVFVYALEIGNVDVELQFCIN